MNSERRVMVIDGQRVAVFDNPLPLPPTLDLMLNGGRDKAGRLWTALRPTVTYPLRLAGPRSECMAQDHRLKPWIEGFHSGSDGQTRYLHLNACADCGGIGIRDASFDSLERLPSGRLPLRRKDHLLGWYSGARPRQRIYT